MSRKKCTNQLPENWKNVKVYLFLKKIFEGTDPADMQLIIKYYKRFNFL